MVTGTVLTLVFVITQVAVTLAARHARKILAPIVEKESGLKFRLGPCRANVLRGTFRASDIGFSVPATNGPVSDVLSIEDLRINLDYLPLILARIDLFSFDIRNVRLAIARNEKGELNVVVPPAKPTDPPKALETPVRKSTATPRIMLERGRVTARVTYSDCSKPNLPPVHIEYDAELRLTNVRTYGATNEPWGRILIEGHRTGTTNFLTRMEARVAPLPDPTRANFDVTGRISSISMTGLDTLSNEMGLTWSNATVDVHIRCRDGLYDPGHSQVTIRFRNPRTVGGLARKTLHVPLPSELVVVAPLCGTADKPELDIASAVLRTILDNATEGVNKAGSFLDRLFGRRKPPQDSRDAPK